MNTGILRKTLNSENSSTSGFYGTITLYRLTQKGLVHKNNQNGSLRERRNQIFPLFRWKQEITPAQLFAGSFLLIIILGAIGFKTLPGLYTGDSLSWLDALFTATSAICVTGLIVVDTATYFTTWGQIYILSLIQLGGLGVIAFTSFIISALGLRLSLRHETLARNTSDIAPHIDPRRLTRDILLFTFITETIGTLFMYVLWVPEFGLGGAFWPAVFHSISAFCNAGFSTFSNSLMDFAEHPMLLSIIMALIVTGGIGFIVLEELHLLYMNKRQNRRFRLSLHSELVIVTTALLLVGGWMLFTLFEWNVSFGNMPAGHKFVNGLFMSVTARTAGFNTVDYVHAADNTNFLTILLMTIGGSPGSTAGGIKTTTFALIGLLAWSRLRGHQNTWIRGRSVRVEATQRSVGLFVIVIGIITVAIFIFTASEIAWVDHTKAGGFLPYMFEAVSAFNTVGLSMSVTDGLSEIGRLTTILLMFLGRVGPLTIVATLARRQRKGTGKFYYAYEDVGIG